MMKMRIVSVEVFTVALPFTVPEIWSKGSRQGADNVLVKLTTDNGVVGWGETSGGSGGTVEVVRAAVDSLIRHVIGMDPFEVGNLWNTLSAAGRWQNLYRLGNLAIAAYEIAIHDIVGRAKDMPISDILGGKRRDSVSFFGYVLHNSVDNMAAHAVRLVSEGHDVLYLKGGLDTNRDVRVLRAILAAVGSVVKIRVDANEALSPADALEWANELAEFELDFIEQPTPAGDLAGMRLVRDQVPQTVAANQGLWSLQDLINVRQAGAADVAVTGPLWVGGIAQLLKVAHTALEAGMPFCRHAPPETGIATAAGLHVLAVLPEVMDGNQIYLGQVLQDDVLAGEGLRFSGSSLGIPDGPGLGIEVDEDRVRTQSELYRTRGGYPQT